MKNYIIVLILLSLFVGIPINDDWWIVSKEEFVGLPVAFARNGSISECVFYVLLIVSHLLFISLLFVTNKDRYKLILRFAPPVYFPLFCLLDFVGALMLIPFLIWWIVCFVKSLKVYPTSQRESKSEILAL